MDARDWALLSDCFTPDAVGDFANGDADGLDAILTQYRNFLNPLEVTQHLVSNVEPAVSGDTATAHTTFQAQHLRTTDGTGQYLLGGNYDDELIKTTAGWKIQKRRVRGLWSAGDATVFARPLTRPSASN
ncbi:nuclear transport factor 2 family protein [Curtobacterium sp. MCPF17_052]|nr:nuclear transport factor 2 family protein [Curtobacterium sp. MCPF17_052]WIB12592.1 nuclear transport factor 2 family protein [Curtobacterium sp. MCPF17_052]